MQICFQALPHFSICLLVYIPQSEFLCEGECQHRSSVFFLQSKGTLEQLPVRVHHPLFEQILYDSENNSDDMTSDSEDHDIHGKQKQESKMKNFLTDKKSKQPAQRVLTENFFILILIMICHQFLQRKIEMPLILNQLNQNWFIQFASFLEKRGAIIYLLTP